MQSTVQGFRKVVNRITRSKHRAHLVSPATLDDTKAIVFLRRKKEGLISRRVAIHGFICKRTGPNTWGVPIPVHVQNYNKGFSSMKAKDAVIFITDPSLVKSMEHDGACFLDPKASNRQAHMIAFHHFYAKPFNLNGMIIQGEDSKVANLYGRGDLGANHDMDKVISSAMNSGLETCHGFYWMQLVTYLFDALRQLFAATPTNRNNLKFKPQTTALNEKIFPKSECDHRKQACCSSNRNSTEIRFEKVICVK